MAELITFSQPTVDKFSLSILINADVDNDFIKIFNSYSNCIKKFIDVIFDPAGF